MTTLTIGGRECLLLNDDEKPRVLLIQPMGAHERDGMAAQVDMTRQAAGVPLVLAAPAIGDWEVELMPWPDAAMSRREHAGECAGHTLSHITEALIPFLRERYGPLPIVLGGYSLGGLFALWAASRCPCFAAVAAVSPSVWIAGWREHAAAHPVRSARATAPSPMWATTSASSTNCCNASRASSAACSSGTREATLPTARSALRAASPGVWGKWPRRERATAWPRTPAGWWWRRT